MFQLLQLCILLYILRIYKCVEYCIVDFDSYGIHFIQNASKDDIGWDEDASKYWPGDTLQHNITSIEGWNKETGTFPDDDWILDQRWESFPTNREDNNLFYNAHNATSVYSMCSGNWPVFKWYHLIVQNDTITNCTPGDEACKAGTNFTKFSEDNSDYIWKHHSITYFYTNTERTSTVELYPQYIEYCISLFYAMCIGCSMKILFGVANSTDFTADGKWHNIKLCPESDLFNFSIFTISQTQVIQPFWAIDKTVIYLKQTCKYKRYIISNLTITCLNALSDRINTSSSLENEICFHTTLPKEAHSSLLLILYIILPLFFLFSVLGVVVWHVCKKKTDYSLIQYIKADNNVEIVTDCQLNDENNLKTRVKTADFTLYVKDLFKNTDIFRLQFDSFPQGYQYSHDEGLKPENVKKNKYVDVIPYDNSRVKLIKNLGDDTFDNDYINASYVEGCCYSKEYIISQNPLEHTFTDFWRMIWQEKVTDIIMICKYDEPCFIYWKQTDQNCKDAAQINLELVNETFCEFYVKRILKFEQFGEERKVTHLQFHSWGVKDAVVSPYIFIDFLNELLHIPHHPSAPIVIHCLGGIGRSATVLTCDIALRYAALTNTIDVFKIVQNIRKSRKNMVRNLDQYKLIHLIIMEMITYEKISVSLNDDFKYILSEYTKDDIISRKFMELLEEKKWIYQAIVPYDVCPSNPRKNRYSHLLPVSHSRVILSNTNKNYIHATRIKDYNQKKYYILAQQPLQNTISDFWTMVVENNVGIIINLHKVNSKSNSTRNCFYFPTQNNPHISFNGNTTLELVLEEQCQYFDTIRATIVPGETLNRPVVIIDLKWNKSQLIPKSPLEILAIWEKIHILEKFKRSIIICCDDGISASGLLACCFYMARKLLHEQVCDIIGAVRAIRRSHLSLINLEQFEFLHTFAAALMEAQTNDQLVNQL